jgi:hypothetical protein
MRRREKETGSLGSVHSSAAQSAIGRRWNNRHRFQSLGGCQSGNRIRHHLRAEERPTQSLYTLHFDGERLGVRRIRTLKDESRLGLALDGGR